MKTCRKCGQELEEDDSEYDPAKELDVFPQPLDEPAADDPCPKVRKKARMTNVLFWFDSMPTPGMTSGSFTTTLTATMMPSRSTARPSGSIRHWPTSSSTRIVPR